jgi:hypothetical protein
MSTAVLSENIKIRLYYWNARGRLQAVRYMLEDIAAKYKHVDYKEDFGLVEKFTEVWLQHKGDENISGPFRNLPVLHWNDTFTFGQTLAIGSFNGNRERLIDICFFIGQFLARNFDLYGKLTSSITDKIFYRGI